MNTKQLDLDDIVVITLPELKQLAKGELVFVEHPTKGAVMADLTTLLVHTKPLTNELKQVLSQHR